MKKRILSLVLSLALVMSLLPFAVAADSTSFTDVSADSWYKTYVDDVVSKGYFKGTSATTFEPETYMTRAMFVTVLARLDGAKVDDTKSSFTDVPADTWYTGSVTWAAQKGIVNGIGNGKFDPDASITREQMCAIMDRYLTYYAKAHNVKVNTKKNAVVFSDQSAISTWAVDSVASCVNYGLIIGFTDGTFQPAGFATRAQVAAVVSRLAVTAKNIGGGGGGRDDDDPVIPAPVTYYTITYMDGTTEIATAQADANGKFVANDYAKADYVFINWKDEDGNVYVAGEEYTTDKNLVLYAQTVADNDYIALAVLGVTEQADDMFGGYYGKSFDEVAAGGAALFSFNAEADGDVRAQDVELVAAVNGDLVAWAIEKSATVAVAFMNSTPADRESVKADVNDAVDAAAEALGAGSISELTLADIKETVYNKFAPTAKSYWSNFFGEEGAYAKKATVTAGDYSFSVAFDEANRIQVDGAYATSKSAKATFVAKFAAAVAKDLYNDLKAYDEYTSEIVMDATIGVVFTDADNAYGAATVNYPHSYPYTVSVTLSAEENVQYKFDAENGSYVKLIVTAADKAAYATAVKSAVETALTTETVKAQLDKYVAQMTDKLADSDTFSKIAVALGKTGMASSVAYAKVDAAVADWQADNLDTANFAQSPLFDKYWNENADAALDNAALYELVEFVADKAAEYVNAQLENVLVGNLLTSVRRYAEPSDLKETLANLADNGYAIDVNLGLEAYPALESYVYAVVADLLNSKEEVNNNYAAAAYDAMTAEIDDMVATKIDAAVASVTIKGVSLTAMLEKVLNLKDFDNIKSLQLGNLATLLKNGKFQSYVGTYGNSTVAKATNYIAKLPAGASVTVNGTVLNKTSLAALQASENTVDACNALAAVIVDNGLGEMSINSFAGDGVAFDVTAKGRTYGFNLVIEVQ